jgi:coenzyme PQQ synthesis protein D (PqqD)
MVFGFGRKGAAHERPQSDSPRPASDVVVARHGDETVLLSVGSGKYYTLNEVGTRVWDLLAEDVPVSEVVRRIAEEYDAPAGVIERDVAALIDSLSEARLLQYA